MSQERAREAVSRGEWQQAYDLLIEADARAPLSAPDLALLADVAYAAGHLDVTIASWERAYAQGMRAGDRLAAAGAAVRVAMHLLFDTALMAPVRGWARRGEQLLEGLDETPVHAWLAVVRNYERLLSGDFQRARQWARRAIETGTRCAPAAAAIGRVAEARSLILEGDVSQGLGLLNEAGVAAVSGELDPLSTGIVYCELVCALQALAQYDLAEEWTEAMERWRQGQPVGSIHGRCRVHRAEILRLRGSCGGSGEGSAAGLRGAAPVPAPRVRVAADRARPHPAAERRYPGRGGGIPRGARGRVGPAARARPGASGAGQRGARGRLHPRRARPSPERPVQGAAAEHGAASGAPPRGAGRDRGRGRQSRSGPSGGRRARAHRGAFESKALAASAALARGRVRLAEGERAGARQEFEAAAQLWNEVGAPYETALARMGLGDAYRAEGRGGPALLEFRAAAVGLRAGRSRARGGRAAQAAAATRSRLTTRRPPRGVDQRDVFRREGDFWSVVFEGQTVRLRDLKGLHYLARLLADPGQEFHVA